MNKGRFYLNGILASAVGIALRTVAIVFAAYVSRTVGAEGVGLNTLIVSAYGFALTFATSGVSLTVTRLVASHIGEGGADRIGKTLRGAAAYALIFSLSATAVLAGFSGFFATACLGDARATLPLQILSASLVPSALGGVISGYFIARRAVIRNSVVQISSQVLRIALTVLLLLTVGSRGVDMAVLSICVGVSFGEGIAFLIAVVLFILERRGAKKTEQRGISIAPVAETALPLALSSYVRSGLLSVEHSIIPRRLSERGDSPAEALSAFGGLHGMALPLVTYPMTPLSSFATLLMPELAEAEGAGEGGRMSRIARAAITSTLTYAILASVILLVFSEELGYVIYGSYTAGYFVSILAPVVPIMYLDHVVDSMLKGIGEQVYSMWVNILDSALSVLLVWLLIPALGIEGYAIVIIIMEAFNFTLSLLRLRGRIKIRIDPVGSILIPAACALGASLLADTLFASGGSMPIWAMVAKLIFVLSSYAALVIPIRMLYSLLRAKACVKKDHKRVAENK